MSEAALARNPHKATDSIPSTPTASGRVWSTTERSDDQASRDDGAEPPLSFAD